MKQDAATELVQYRGGRGAVFPALTALALPTVGNYLYAAIPHDITLQPPNFIASPLPWFVSGSFLVNTACSVKGFHMA